MENQSSKKKIRKTDLNLIFSKLPSCILGFKKKEYSAYL